MTNLSADLALADSEARASRERVTVDEVMRLAYEYRWMSFDTAEKAESAMRTAVEALVTEREAMKVALSALVFHNSLRRAERSAMSDLHETERERFEAWAHSIMLIPVDRMANGEYVLLAANDCWQAWQARAALAPAVPPGYVLVSERKLRRAADVLTLDGDEHGVGGDLLDMLAAAPSAKEPTCPKN